MPQSTPRRLLALFTALALAWTGSSARADDGALHLDQDTFTTPSGVVEITRPDAGWVFFDLAVQRRMLAKDMSPQDLSASFQSLVARLHHLEWNATFSVFVYEDPAGTDLAAREKQVIDSLVQSGVKLTGRGRGGLWGLTILKVDYLTKVKGRGGQPDGVYFVSRIDCPVTGKKKLVVTVFEVLKADRKRVAKHYKTILKRLKVNK